MSAVAKGLLDQIMRSRGKVSVRRTSLDWMSESEMMAFWASRVLGSMLGPAWKGFLMSMMDCGEEQI